MSRFRWSQQESDEARLPEGMKRVGYDADTQTYTYRDHRGSNWEGASGARYGVLNRTGGDRAKTVDKESLTEEKLTSADAPHKQLFGALSSGFGRLLNGALDLISQSMAKESSHASEKQQSQRPSKRRTKKQSQRHTQRRRRRPEKWHEK
ncbi:hypothetical protein N431DRAFT_381499 [Stipitochalara longipes BDJ]|nr:hypothetical protein N431DRAFT_381499 [Stipitochalara longipes BDJ]